MPLDESVKITILGMFGALEKYAFDDKVRSDINTAKAAAETAMKEDPVNFTTIQNEIMDLKLLTFKDNEDALKKLEEFYGYIDILQQPPAVVGPSDATPQIPIPENNKEGDDSETAPESDLLDSDSTSSQGPSSYSPPKGNRL